MTKEKLKKPIFKRWWFWVLVILLVFGMFSVGGKDGEESPVPTTTDESATKTDIAEDVSESITLTAGELGEYGKEIIMNEGTDMPETLIVYYLPAGDYTVKNVGDYPTQVNVYEGFTRDESTGYDDYTNVGDIVRLDVDQTADINVPDGWFIEIHEPTKIELVVR